MARLNEPPVSTDSFDALRRKFLRQNRDIARVNSNQSLRIRGLENECARLLSENLDLRGQVLRLEKEVESNTSQRIADHALQIKRKMETQLNELGALLADFGLEPPTKRTSPPVPQRSVTKALARLSLGGETASPLFNQKRHPALAPQDAEALAAQEGRLPPILENKTYPRQNMTREELRALLSDDSTGSDSPGLEPPSVSRLFYSEARKSTASSSLSSSNDNILKENRATGRTRTATAAESTAPSKPLADVPTKTATQPVGRTEKQGAEPNAADPGPVARPATSSAGANAVVPVSTKAGAKRKFTVNDDNARSTGSVPANGAVPASATENQSPVRELKNPRSIRDLVNSRNKETKEGAKEGQKTVTSGARRPLAAKSTNEDVSSPRKRLQESNGGKPPVKPSATGGSRTRDRAKRQPPVTIRVADVPEPPVVVDISVHASKDGSDAAQTSCPEPEQLQPTNPDIEPTETEPPSAATTAVCPSTPPQPTLVSQRLVPTHGEGGRDTPPPADISSHGETIRPSRRARTSVSYVEPNLRDKMRRPTKELFDAVAGEGKYVQRQQLQNQPHNDGEKSQPTTEGPLSRPKTPASASGQEKEHPHLPLVSKQNEVDPTTDKRRPRALSVGASGSAKEKPATPDEKDPYDILTSLGDSSMSSEDAGAGTETGTLSGSSGRKSASGGGRASAKSTRRASAAAASATHEGDSTNVADRHTRPSATRKRASMAAMKRSSMLDSDEEEDDPADSSYEPPTAEHSTRDRISRRRSMML